MPSESLPVLSTTTTTTRQSALKRAWQKCEANQLLLIHKDCNDEVFRLKSWNPQWKHGQQLIREDFDIEIAWCQE